MRYIIIPARLESKRLPNKPILKRTGKYLIQHTWEKCKQSKLADDVIIATDSSKLRKICESFGATVIITEKARFGSERCAFAAQYLIEPDYVINVQCEYPEVNPRKLDFMFKTLKKRDDDCIISYAFDYNGVEIFSPNTVKIIPNQGLAFYFSRSPIPYNASSYIIHVGIYGFGNRILQLIPTLKLDPKLKGENLEQLYWWCVKIPTILLDYEKPMFGIDTEEEYTKWVESLQVEQQS